MITEREQADLLHRMVGAIVEPPAVSGDSEEGRRMS